MNRLECISRLQDHAEDETLPAEVRQTCSEVARKLRKFKWDIGFWPTEKAYAVLGKEEPTEPTPKAGDPFPPNLAKYMESVSSEVSA